MSLKDWNERFEPAAPTGLSQRRQAEADSASGLESWNQRFSSSRGPNWFTGGRVGGTENGWNNEFYDKMFKQQQEALEKNEMNKLYTRPDFTGVALWDQGPRRFGYVYEDGKEVGQIHELYGEEVGNQILGSLMLDNKTLQRSNSPEKLAREIENRRDTIQSDFEKAASAQAFQSDLDDRMEEWDETGKGFWVDLANIGGSTAGGIAAGARFGWIGGIAGGLIGLAGGIMNRDLMREQAARAELQAELAAKKQNGLASALEMAEGYGGLGLQYLAPLSNLTQGIYDATSEGGIGDGEAAWYDTDETGEETRGWGWTAAGLAATVGDGFGLFGSKLGLRSFQAAMGTTIVGSAGSLATTGETFDPRRGDFDNIFLNEDGDFDLGSSLAGLGNQAIDVVQLGGASGLMRSARDSLRIFSRGKDGTPGALQQSKELIAPDRHVIGGWSYKLAEDGSQAVSRRMSLAMLAPSEMIQGVTHSMLARTRTHATTGIGGGRKLIADDYYQAALRLSAGQRPWTNTLATAIGEGYEEAAQAVLEPWSHNATPEWNEIVNSAMQGAARGLGMGAAASMMGAKQDQKLRTMANWSRGARGPISDEEWNSMSYSDKLRAVSDSREFAEAVQDVLVEEAERATALTEATSMAPAQRVQELALKELARDAKNATPRTDERFRITSLEDPSSMSSEEVHGSARAIKMTLAKSLRGMERELELLPADDPGRARLTLVVEEAKKIQNELDRLLGRDTEDPRDFKLRVQEVNSLLARLFRGEALPNDTAETATPELLRARAQAATALYVRHPVDGKASFVALLPQINLNLTYEQADTVLLVHPNILDPLGGDFDGDTIQQMAKLVLDEAQYLSLRKGDARRTLEGKAPIPLYERETFRTERLQEMFRAPLDSAAHSNAQAVLDAIRTRLESRYQTVVGFQEHLDTFLRQMENGTNLSAREDFINALSSDATIMEQLDALDELGLTDELVRIAEVVQQELSRFQILTAGRQRPKSAPRGGVMPTDPQTEAFTVRQARAATEGATALSLARGWELIRVLMGLKFVSGREALVSAQDIEKSNPDLQAASAAFLELDQGLSQRYGELIEQMGVDDTVQGRTLARLTAIAERMGQTGNGVPINVAVASRLMVLNVDAQGNLLSRPGEAPRITLLQKILREEVEAEQARLGDALIAARPELQLRHSTLLRLTRPRRENKGGDYPTVDYSGRAAVEVFDAIPLFALDGDAAGTLGADQTVGQLFRRLMNHSVDARLKELDLAYNEVEGFTGTTLPKGVEYSAEELESGSVTGYRAILDILYSATNHELSMVRSGASHGAPTGLRAQAANSVRKDVRKTLAVLRQAVHEFVQLNPAERSADSIETMQEFFAKNDTWALSYLRAMVDDVTARSFFTLEREDEKSTPTLKFQSWLLEALTIQDPAEAEWFLLRRIIMTSYNAIEFSKLEPGSDEMVRKFESLNDTVHRLMALLSLSQMSGNRMEDFLVLMKEARTSEEFERRVNVEFAEPLGLPPIMAWDRDAAATDPSKNRAAMNEASSAREQREALQRFRTESERYFEALKKARLRAASDSAVIATVREALKNPPAENSRNARILRKLEAAIEARKKNGVLLSPADRHRALAVLNRGVAKGNASKGKVAPELQALATAEAAQEEFRTPLEQTIISTLSRSPEAIKKTPSLAIDGVQITETDGTPVDFEGLTLEFIVENWDDPASQNFIRSMLFPFVYESTGTPGQYTKKYLVEPSLQALVEGAPIQEALMADGKEGLFASLVDGHAYQYEGRNAFIEQQLDLMQLITGSLTRALSHDPESSVSDRRIIAFTEKQLANLLKDLGRLLNTRVTVTNSQTGEDERIIAPGRRNDGSIVEDPVELVSELVALELRENLAASLLGVEVDYRINPERKKDIARLYAVDVMAEAYESAAAVAPDLIRAEEILDEAAQKVEFTRAFLNEDTVALGIELFGFRDSAAANSLKQKKRLIQIVRANPELRDRAPWAIKPILKVLEFDPSLSRDQIGYSNPDQQDPTIPAMSDNDWNLLSRAVIGNWLSRLTGITSKNDGLLPVFPDFREEHSDPAVKQALDLWDPSRARIFERIISSDNPLVRAARDIVATYSPNIASKSPQAIADRLTNALLGEKKDADDLKIGAWTPLDVGVMVDGDGRVPAAGATTGVQMSGMASKHMHFLGMRWRRTYLSPTPDSASHISIPMDGLQKHDDNAMLHRAVTRPNQTVDAHTSLMLMNGRAITSAKIFAKGQEVGDLWQGNGLTRNGLGVTYRADPTGVKEGLRFTTVEEIRKKSAQWLDEYNRANTGQPLSEADLTIEIDFFHPDDKPSNEFTGNIYYEGTLSRDPNTDQYPSLVAAMFEQPGSLVRLVQQWALQAQKKGFAGMQLGDTVSRETNAMLRTPWARDMSAMLQAMAGYVFEAQKGKKRLSPLYYNGLLEFFRKSVFVRAADKTTSQPVLLTADDVIRLQAQNAAVKVTDDQGVERPWTLHDQFNLAELYMPSEEVRDTLYGRSGPLTTPAALGRDFDLDFSDVPAFTGEFTPAELEAISGALTIDPETGDWKRLKIQETSAVEPQDFQVLQYTQVSEAEWARRQQLPRRRALEKLHMQEERSKTSNDNIKFRKFSEKNADLVMETLTDASLKQMEIESQVISGRPAGLQLSDARMYKDLSRILLDNSDRTGFAIWNVVANGHTADPVKGLHNADSILKSSLSAVGISPGDIANVNVDTFLKKDGDLHHRQLETTLQILVDRGAVIHLYSQTKANEAVAIASRFMTEVSTYQPVMGSTRIFEERLDLQETANERSLESGLLAMESIDHRERFLVMVSDDTDNAENAATILWDADNAPEHIVLTTELIKTMAYDRFAPPVTPESIRDATAVIRNVLTDKEGRKALAENAGIKGEGALKAFNRDIDSLLARLDRNPNAMIPDRDLRRGEIIPLVSKNPATQEFEVVLARHGYKTLSPETLTDQFDSARKPSSPLGVSLAIETERSGPEETVHEGPIASVTNRAGFGYEAKLHIPISEILTGSKYQLELSGFKVVIRKGGKRYILPKASFLDGKGLDLQVALGGLQSKNSFEGFVTNYRELFSVFGHDFTRDLTEFTTGVKYNSKDYPGATRKMLEGFVELSRRMTRYSTHELRYFAESSVLPAAMREEILEVFPDGASWLNTLETHLSELRTGTPSSLSATEKANAALVFPILLYMASMNPQTRDVALIHHVLRSSGIHTAARAEQKAFGQKMPRLVTEFWDSLPLGHPLKQRITSDISSILGEGYEMSENFVFTMFTGGGKGKPKEQTTFLLSAPQAFPTTVDNPVMDKMSRERGTSQELSGAILVQANMALDSTIRPNEEFESARKFLERRNVMDTSTPEQVWQMLHAVQPPRFNPNLSLSNRTALDMRYFEIARDVAGGIRKEIDFEYYKENFTEVEFNQYMDRVTNEIDSLASLLNLKPQHKKLIHYWIRQFNGQPAPRKADEPEVSFDQALNALQDLRLNVEHGFLPTLGAAIPMMHYSDLAILFQSSSLNGKGLQLLGGIEESAKLARTWDEWVKTSLAIGHSEDQVFDDFFLTINDHMYHSYFGREESLAGLPVSMDDLRNNQLYDSENNMLALSLSPLVDAKLRDPVVLDGRYKSLGEIFGVTRVGSVWEGTPPRNSQAARIQRARARWRAEGKIARTVPKKMKDFVREGGTLVEEQSTKNAVTRMALNLRAGMALTNPLLWVSAVFEMGVRTALDSVVTGIMGDGIRFGSGLASRAKLSPHTPEEVARYKNLIKGLGSRKEFRAMLYGQLMYQPDYVGRSALERGTAWFARLGSFMQDPTWGMRGDVLARRYLEAVVDYLRTDPTHNIVSSETLIAHLNSNPRWVADNIPAAHQMGLARIANNRSLKQTPISLALNGVINPMTENPNQAINMASNLLLKLPLMFANFGANVIVNYAGLQAPMAILSQVLHGRANPFTGLQSALAGKGWQADPDAKFDMSSTMESLDLTRAFVQSGVSHATLFALAALFGSLGLDGEDEEERRRRLAAEHQGMFVAKDPRDIVNDFRNADALFLDNLPFGLGLGFLVPDPEDTNTGHTLAEAHWMLKQFISPIMGMQRFFDTGDWRNILWGYQDALGSMPLINTATWDDANRTVQRLSAIIPEDADEDDTKAILDAYGFWIRMLMTYENMLFEHSFVNQLRVNADKYDRDPWILPERDDTGQIIRKRLDMPERSSALTEFEDPETGEIRMSYAKRDWWDATLHGFAENRGTLAMFMELFTGFKGSYQRDNMVPRTVKIDKAGVSEDQAYDLVKGLYANEVGGGLPEGMEFSRLSESGREELTADGAEAVIRGVWKGYVDLGAPSLEGVYIPWEMREIIETRLINDLIQEGLDLGLSEYHAKGRMYDIWYGPKDNPEVIGLRDIVYSDQIPASPTSEYYQLNTTYIQGPDGYFHATGVTRGLLETAFGFAPLQRYYNSELGDPGLPADGRLNSVDPASGVNTGRRALEKVDESWHVKTLEEILKESDKRIEEALNKAFSSSNDGRQGFGSWGRGGSYGRGGGGGYGGGSGWFRLSTPERNNPIYSSNDPYVRPDDPIIRRAQIRRERFSSQRGRLNQWQ